MHKVLSCKNWVTGGRGSGRDGKDTTTKVMFNPTFGKPDNIHYIVIVHCSLNLFHFIIYCNNCKQTACNLFTDSKGDEDNVRLHFPTDHRCLFCRQSFKNQIEREKHKKTQLTTGQNPYHCPKCEASFKTMSEHEKFQNDYYLEKLQFENICCRFCVL